MQEKPKNTGVQHRAIGFKLAWGKTPHKVTRILHSHHFLLPCIKKKERIKIKIKNYGSLVHHSMFSPPLDDSCLSFHVFSLYVGMFWFGIVGHTSPKLSMVLSLKFECNDHTYIRFLI
jgi:hypothetical protein